MAYRDLAKDAVIVGITQVLVNLSNFLLLPIITKTLGSSDYGLWIQVLVTVSLLSALAQMGMSVTLLRFFKPKDGRRERSVLFFTILSFVSLVGGLMAIAIALLAGPLADAMFSDKGLYLLIIAIAPLVLFTAITDLISSYFRAAEQIKTYAAINIFHAFGEVGLILVFVLLDLGVVGAVIGSLIISAITFIIGLALVIRQIGVARPSYVLMRQNLKFGLPLAPNTLIRWITSSSDRYLVAYLLGLSMAGIYSAAYGIGAVIFLFVTPLQISLYPVLSKLYDDGRHDKVVEYTERSVRHYLMFTVPAVAGISVLAGPILTALTTSEFAQGSVVIPFIALAGLFSGLFKFTENITHLVKKTHLNLITFGIPAIAGVLLVLTITPFLGIAGTAIASTLAYGLMLLIGIVISRHFIKLSMDWSFLGKAVLSAGFMACAITLIDPVGMVDVALSIGVGMGVYFLALYILKGFTSDEMDLFRRALGRLRRGGPGIVRRGGGSEI